MIGLAKSTYYKCVFVIVLALEMFSSCEMYALPNICLINLAESHPLYVEDGKSFYTCKYVSNDETVIITHMKWIPEKHEQTVCGEYEVNINIGKNDTYFNVYDILNTYAVLTCVDTDAETLTNSFEHHKCDFLLAFNGDNEADILYKSDKYERILFGNSDYVILYNCDKNSYEYVDISTKQKMNVIDSDIRKSGDYYFTYNEDGNSLLCTYSGMFIWQREFIEEIPITP